MDRYWCLKARLCLSCGRCFSTAHRSLVLREFAWKLQRREKGTSKNGVARTGSVPISTNDASYGSSIRSNGNVAIAATGGDLNIIGSQVDGKNVALAASNDINLLSQSEQHRSDSKNKNGSAEIGVSVGSTTGFYVTASAGKRIRRI